MNTTNLSLHVGNFEASALKGIFYLVIGGHTYRENNPWENSEMPFLRFWSLSGGRLIAIHAISPGRHICHTSRLDRVSVFLEEAICSSLRNAKNVPGPPEVFWIVNEDTNLGSNSKKKIPLNNEWISENDLIWILRVLAVSMFENGLWKAVWRSDLSAAAFTLRT